MRIHRVLLALCVGTLMLVAAAPAGATVTLGLTAGEDTLASSGNVSFTAGEVTVRCAVSLTGSFNEAITQSSGEALGSVTRGSASGCEGGERPAVTFLSLPWTLAYSSFSGEEPERLTAILGSLNTVSVDVVSGRLNCLYRGEVGLSFALEGIDPDEVGAISTLTNSLTLVSGAGCARTASMRGSFRLSRAEWLTEYAPGGSEMGADPSRLVAGICGGGGCMVTFTNDTGATITVTSDTFGTATGWTRTNNCTSILNMRTCTVQLIAAGATVAGQYRLIAGTTIVGRVNLVPQ